MSVVVGVAWQVTRPPTAAASRDVDHRIFLLDAFRRSHKRNGIYIVAAACDFDRGPPLHTPAHIHRIRRTVLENGYQFLFIFLYWTSGTPVAGLRYFCWNADDTYCGSFGLKCFRQMEDSSLPRLWSGFIT